MYFSPEVCHLYLPSYLSGPCKAIKEVPKNHQLIVAYIWYHQWLQFPLYIGEKLMMPRAAEEGECCSEKRVGNVLYQLFNEGDARQLARCCPISNHAEKNRIYHESPLRYNCLNGCIYKEEEDPQGVRLEHLVCFLLLELFTLRCHNNTCTIPHKV